MADHKDHKDSQEWYSSICPLQIITLIWPLCFFSIWYTHEIQLTVWQQVVSPFRNIQIFFQNYPEGFLFGTEQKAAVKSF